MVHLKKTKSGHLAKIPNPPPPEPDTDCTDCAENCDGGAGSTVTLSVSGFTGICSIMNKTILLTWVSECFWLGSVGVGVDEVVGFVQCTGGTWFLTMSPSDPPFDAICDPCSLLCIDGNAPTGSGSIFGTAPVCGAQVGSFTLS